MPILNPSFFEVTRYITHTISLIAYVCALITYYFVTKNISDRKKLAANPKAYIATAERLHIDFKAIPVNERAKITLQILKNRITSLKIMTGTIVIIGIMVAYVSINYLQGKRVTEKPYDNNIIVVDTLMNKTPLIQQHTGSGDNIGRDKNIKK